MLADDRYPDRGARPFVDLRMTTRWPGAPGRSAVAVAVGAGLMAVGLGIAALARAPLTWDGAWFFVRTADTAMPTFLARRAIHAVLEAPLIVVTRATGDVDLGSLAFSIPYVLVPLVGWLAAWRVVRHERPDTMLWPALGICLVTLPGQVFFLIEGSIITHLAWALLLAAAMGSVGRHRGMVVALTALIAISHPFSGPTLIGIGLVAALAPVARSRVAEPDPDPGGATRPPGRDGRWVAAGFLALGSVATVASLVLRSAYEIEMSTLDELIAKFRAAILDPATVAPLAAWAIGLLAAVRIRPRVRLAAITTILLVTTAVLIGWALDPIAWASALRFRAWPVLLAVPVAALAVADVLRPAPWRDRRLVLVAAPLVMAVVLGVQATSWVALRDRLAAALAASAVPCVEGTPLRWIAGTALDHWSLTSLAIADEGRDPRHLALVDRSCAAALAADRRSVVIKATPFDHDERPVDGWWGFERLADAWPALAPP